MIFGTRLRFRLVEEILVLPISKKQDPQRCHWRLAVVVSRCC